MISTPSEEGGGTDEELPMDEEEDSGEQCELELESKPN
jgi:hypothetical protein